MIIANFFDAYDTFSSDYIGQNNYPINWVLREDFEVGPSTTLAPKKHYSSIHGLVEDEMIQRFARSHPFYKTDNANVYAQLVISTLVSQYAFTIVPLKGAKNGCEAINQLKYYFSGAAHWDIEVKVNMDFLLNGNCNDQTAITLHTFLAKHRASFHFLQRCGDQVTVDIPSDRTRVGHLL